MKENYLKFQEKYLIIKLNFRVMTLKNSLFRDSNKSCEPSSHMLMNGTDTTIVVQSCEKHMTFVDFLLPEIT